MPIWTPRRRTVWQTLRLRYHRRRRRLARHLPLWFRRTGPVGTSVLLHAIVLLVLALLIHHVSVDPPRDPNILGQLRDDLTSLNPADRTGDPFTHLDSIDPPSLPPTPDQVDPLVINVPAAPPEVRIGPITNELPDDEASATARAKGRGARAAPAPGTVAVPFTGRRGPMKSALVRREGGTVESEAAVERGLDWIARHQRADGGWSLDTNIACTEPPGCPPRNAMVSDTAATGLALLPLLAAGHTHTEPGRYQATIRRGLAWLVGSQQEDGSLFIGGGLHTTLYSHAIATMALCEAYALTHDPALRPPAQRAVNFITRSQNVAGGWRYEPLAPGDTSVFGWMLFALRSADIGEVAVSRRTIKRATTYLNSVTGDKPGSTYCYMPGWSPSMTMTAEGLVGRQLLGWSRENPALQRGVALIAANLEESTDRNIYYWYYATQLLHNMRGDDWERWNPRVRDGLIGMQIQGAGCDRGSWDPTWPQSDRWGIRAGRLYTTSLSLLTLEVYYRYLPLYRDQGGPLAGRDEPDPAQASVPSGAAPVR